ncbi:MAG TPA: GGDEF domain-containing protein [Gammaproteobacteria bacterium]|nr:GGDEF domain-containing protein [Gammaproteobacteria bacterium]
MSTPQALETGSSFTHFNPDAVNLALSGRASNDSTDPGLNAALKLNTILQTTLDVNTIIRLFAAELGGLVHHDHFRYRNPAYQLDLGWGKDARHSCSYRLIVHEEMLGELILQRRTKFTGREAMIIEKLLCGLVYPLRNALLYLSAVRAAHRDPLTGVSNRAAMDDALVREIEMSRRHGTPLSLIVLDIDKFKTINDTHGHASGDDVLKAFADTVGGLIRKTDILFRYGGEEFVVLLSNTGAGGAELLAERLRQGVEQTVFATASGPLPVTVSAGVATLKDGDDPVTLLTRADKALYQAKNTGRNRICIAAQPA